MPTPIFQSTNFSIYPIAAYIETLFLVEYAHGLLLLDGGCRCDVKQITDFIEQELRRPISDLKLMVITHPHPDHSGAAPQLQRQYRIPIAASPTVNDWYTGFDGWMTQKVDIALTYYVARKMQKPLKHLRFPRTIQIDYPLREGETLPRFPDWQLWRTAGHTVVDTSVVNLDASVAYVADVLIGLGTRYSLPYPISDPVQYRATLERFKNANLNTLLLAHHGRHEIDNAIWEQLIAQIPSRPKNHIASVHKRLRWLVPFGSSENS